MRTRILVGWFLTCAMVQGGIAVAAPDASELTGRIVSSSGSRGISGISVKLLDREGTVMDVVETGKNGEYVLDLGVLDSVTPTSVKALYLEIKSKSGRKSRAKVADVINAYSDIVTIKNIIAP